MAADLREIAMVPPLRGGDPRKMVAAMIEAAEMAEPPRRLLLGSDAYALVTEALAQRRADFEANRAVSVSTDSDDWVDPPDGLRPCTTRILD
jgi:hypothetical protein